MDPATAESVSDSASWVHCRLKRMWKSVRLKFNPVAMSVMVEVGDRFWHFVSDQPAGFGCYGLCSSCVSTLV